MVDDGFFLHKVIWSRTDSLHKICKRCVKFVCGYYRINVRIHFDGNPLNPNVKATKSVERYRMCHVNASIDHIFDGSTIAQVTQEKFLDKKITSFALFRSKWERSFKTM